MAGPRRSNDTLAARANAANAPHSSIPLTQAKGSITRSTWSDTLRATMLIV